MSFKVLNTYVEHVHAFAKFREVSISLVGTVHSSVRMEQFRRHSADYGKILYWGLFINLRRQISRFLKIGKKIWHFTQRPKYIYDNRLNSSGTKINSRENHNTHFMLQDT
jgi:hypothetical protein